MCHGELKDWLLLQLYTFSSTDGLRGESLTLPGKLQKAMSLAVTDFLQGTL